MTLGSASSVETLIDYIGEDNSLDYVCSVQRHQFDNSLDTLCAFITNNRYSTAQWSDPEWGDVMGCMHRHGDNFTMFYCTANSQSSLYPVCITYEYLDSASVNLSKLCNINTFQSSANKSLNLDSTLFSSPGIIQHRLSLFNSIEWDVSNVLFGKIDFPKDDTTITTYINNTHGATNCDDCGHGYCPLGSIISALTDTSVKGSCVRKEYCNTHIRYIKQNSTLVGSSFEFKYYLNSMIYSVPRQSVGLTSNRETEKSIDEYGFEGFTRGAVTINNIPSTLDIRRIYPCITTSCVGKAITHCKQTSECAMILIYTSNILFVYKDMLYMLLYFTDHTKDLIYTVFYKSALLFSSPSYTIESPAPLITIPSTTESWSQSIVTPTERIFYFPTRTTGSIIVTDTLTVQQLTLPDEYKAIDASFPWKDCIAFHDGSIFLLPTSTTTPPLLITPLLSMNNLAIIAPNNWGKVSLYQTTGYAFAVNSNILFSIYNNGTIIPIEAPWTESEWCNSIISYDTECIYFIPKSKPYIIIYRPKILEFSKFVHLSSIEWNTAVIIYPFMYMYTIGLSSVAKINLNTLSTPKITLACTLEPNPIITIIRATDTLMWALSSTGDVIKIEHITTCTIIKTLTAPVALYKNTLYSISTYPFKFVKYSLLLPIQQMLKKTSLLSLDTDQFSSTKFTFTLNDAPIIPPICTTHVCDKGQYNIQTRKCQYSTLTTKCNNPQKTNTDIWELINPIIVNVNGPDECMLSCCWDTFINCKGWIYTHTNNICHQATTTNDIYHISSLLGTFILGGFTF
jgi:hypothetical protein